MPGRKAPGEGTKFYILMEDKQQIKETSLFLTLAFRIM